MLPSIPPELLHPPREYSLLPFWFWNDDLDETELARQIDEFQAHGVHGFVIHPRVGLPRDIGWMSPRMLALVRFAVEQAAQRGMQVLLYDEGMYPSGSSSGQVVAENPSYQCRCLAREFLSPGQPLALPAGHNLVAAFPQPGGETLAVIDRPADSFIRGLHYIGDGPAEDEPPAADLLNPAAVQSFIRHVYDSYAAAVGDFFGTTVIAIFTDEPNLLGRCRERGVQPGTTGILERVNAVLGYDFTPHLPALWDDALPDAAVHRADYRRALLRCLEESYYRPLHDWCERHGLALAGHPASPDALGLMRYFHIPGQDLVWRWVLPTEPSGLEGPESTQAKCSSSAALHLNRRRNSNECFGAYGHAFTWDEMKSLVDWCFVRGVNMLFPHAFYYSLRGPRRDERPPDVGPHSPWWDGYADFAAYCARMCWLNAASQPVCGIAILGESDRLPWSAAKICYQHQRDFNYLELRHLWEDAKVSSDGVSIAGMRYTALILDGFARIPPEAEAPLRLLSISGRLILWDGSSGLPAFPGALRPRTASDLLDSLGRLAPPDVLLFPVQPDLRARHVIKDGLHYYMLSNEGRNPIRARCSISRAGKQFVFDPYTLALNPREDDRLDLPPHALTVLVCDPTAVTAPADR